MTDQLTRPEATEAQRLDAAQLRFLGERMQQRGEDGMAALTFQMARWVEACIALPADLVHEALASITDDVEG